MGPRIPQKWHSVFVNVEWARITGLKANTIKARLIEYGWPVERALSDKPKFYHSPIKK